jgi:hypothetical protein
MQNDENLPQRVAQLEQKNESAWSVLSRIFDIDPRNPDQVQVLVSIRDALLYAKEMGGRRIETEKLLDLARRLDKLEKPSLDELIAQVRMIHSMTEPSFNEVIAFTKRAMLAETNKVKNVNSALRLIVATIVGGVIVGVILWKITGHA